jgi:hypothetical protein
MVLMIALSGLAHPSTQRLCMERDVCISNMAHTAQSPTNGREGERGSKGLINRAAPLQLLMTAGEGARRLVRFRLMTQDGVG